MTLKPYLITNNPFSNNNNFENFLSYATLGDAVFDDLRKLYLLTVLDVFFVRLCIVQNLQNYILQLVLD